MKLLRATPPRRRTIVMPRDTLPTLHSYQFSDTPPFSCYFLRRRHKEISTFNAFDLNHLQTSYLPLFVRTLVVGWPLYISMIKLGAVVP
jgi:hypothetical protein